MSDRFEEWLDDPAAEASGGRPERGERRRRRRGRVQVRVSDDGSTRVRSDGTEARASHHGKRKGKRRKKRELSPEERAYREARKAAARKMGFLAHLVPYATVCFFLLFVAGFRPAMIVAMAWGIGLACHYFFAIVAPGLRQRLIDQEVERHVHRGVSEQRKELATEHTQRLEQLSASIAHEIRNPITAARSLVQQMGEDPGSRDNVEYAGVALEELQRVEKSISHLLRYAREEDMHVEHVQMVDVVDSALETLRERLTKLGVEITRDFDGVGAFDGDGGQLRRVLVNLVGNALDAFDEAHVQTPQLEIHSGENLAGSEVWIRIRDNGPGIDPERLEQIFEPFHTSKASGTGLGLAISKKVVDAHGGTLEAHSDPGQGTEFVITLPKTHAEENGTP